MLICSAPNKPFANGKQRIWHSQRAKRMLSRADQQQGSDQDDAAYLEKLLGDSAGRTPKQLSAKAQKHLQLLRSESNSLQPLQNRPQTGNSSNGSVGYSHAEQSSTASGSHSPIPGEVAADGTAERLPTKAELRGTLGTVNRKVYEQVTQSRSRISTKLSAANKHIRQLQKAAELHQHQVAAMHERLTRVTTELASLSTTANLAHSRAQSANPGRLVASTASVLGSVTRLQQMVQHHTAEIDQLRQRRISIVWFGIAQEVRLMGSFDNWTQGFSLSPEAFSDGTFTKFEGILWLVPGQYEVKFMVDGHWRTAPDWPTVQTQHGQNNVLQVD